MNLAHWDDIPFERAFHDVPLTLIDHKRRLSLITGVLVGLGHNPCGGIRNSLGNRTIQSIANGQEILSTHQVQYLASLDECVKAIHHFLDGSHAIPQVGVENVDVRSPEFLQAGLDTDMHRFHIVSGKHCLLLDPNLRVHEI